MKFAKNPNIICFSRKELSGIFEVSRKIDLLRGMQKEGIPIFDMADHRQRMKKLACDLGERYAQDRDDHEIFAALYVFLNFYGAGSEACFEVQDSFNPSKDRIASLQDLKEIRKISSDSDFILKADDGFRKFQLKRYREGMNADEIFDFIKKKLAHYGNNLGDTNLLIQLQPKPYTRSNIEFRKIYENIKSLNLKFQGAILISYNQNDEDQVLAQVYPVLSKNKIPILYPSAQRDSE